jgi:flagellar protein FlaF
METIIVSLICIALIVFGGMTMAQGFMTSVDASTTGLEEIGQRDETIMRTELTPVSASLSASDTLEVTLQNTGQTKLADFDKWDVIVQYYDGTGAYYTKWLPHTTGTLSNNEWEVLWIRLDGEDELFEPNVLNPEESIMIRAQLDPSVGAGTTNMVVVATPGGITASTYFSP